MINIKLPKFIRKSSPVFKHFLQLDEVVYQGMVNDKITSFVTKEKKQEGKVLMLSMIREEENQIWISSKELLGQIFSTIEPKLQGFFQFELLSMEMSEDWDNFQWGEFSKGMTDLAQGLTIGKSQFAQYCSIFGVLTRHSDEDFGKIAFHPHMKMFDKKPEELDGMLLRLIRESQRSQDFRGQNRLVFYDLSRDPLYDSSNKNQIARLEKMGHQLESKSLTSPGEVYIIDQNGLHPLFQKSQLELF